MSTNNGACPACDADSANLTATEAFAMGFAVAEAGLRAGFVALGEGPHKALCNRHLTTWSHVERDTAAKLDQLRRSRGGT